MLDVQQRCIITLYLVSSWSHCLSQSSPPGQITRAGRFIEADTGLAAAARNFSETFGGWCLREHEMCSETTQKILLRLVSFYRWDLGEMSLVQELLSPPWLDIRTWMKSLLKQCRMTSCVHVQAFLLCVPLIHGVKQTDSALVTLDLILGLWPAATHSTHWPLKYRRIRLQLHIQSCSALCASRTPHSPGIRCKNLFLVKMSHRYTYNFLTHKIRHITWKGTLLIDIALNTFSLEIRKICFFFWL